MFFPELELAHEGKCVKQDPKETSEMCLATCSTSMDIKPVCGTDGNTYVNKGALQCQKKCYNEGGYHVSRRRAFDSLIDSSMLSNPADAHNVSCLGLCGRDICPKS